MSNDLTLGARDRLLVFAPHPDDETLATGGLIQRAGAVGAAVRVVFATDGDNNPWPQRWLERRWRIDAAARARWGALRRAESLRALAALGLRRGDADFLGWPDQGLTDRLMRDDRGETELARIIGAFAPTCVAVPSLADRHPDHSALRIMVELALARTPHAVCPRWGYVVHGMGDGVAGEKLVLTDAEREGKRRALLEHATQLSLSRARLLRFAARPEVYVRADQGEPALAAGARGELVLHVPTPIARRRSRRNDLLLILAGENGVARWRIPLRRGAASNGARVVRDIGGDWRVTLPVDAARAAHGYVKLERPWPRLVVFDTQGWHDLAEWLEPKAEASALTAHSPARP